MAAQSHNSAAEHSFLLQNFFFKSKWEDLNEIKCGYHKPQDPVGQLAIRIIIAYSALASWP